MDPISITNILLKILVMVKQLVPESMLQPRLQRRLMRIYESLADLDESFDRILRALPFLEIEFTRRRTQDRLRSERQSIQETLGRLRKEISSLPRVIGAYNRELVDLLKPFGSGSASRETGVWTSVVGVAAVFAPQFEVDDDVIDRLETIHNRVKKAERALAKFITENYPLRSTRQQQKPASSENA